MDYRHIPRQMSHVEAHLRYRNPSESTLKAPVPRSYLWDFPLSIRSVMLDLRFWIETISMAGEPILIVDPVQVNLNLIRLLLTYEGYIVRTAAGAEEAIEMLGAY